MKEGTNQNQANTADESSNKKDVQQQQLQPNIGWFFPCKQQQSNDVPPKEWHLCDQKLVAHCVRFGNFGYSFITYPLGGMKRYFWRPSSMAETVPPPIHLPDLQLEAQFWQKYVNCAISSWIDPDSADEGLAALSLEHFGREVDYAKYLGITSVLIELKHANSPELAKLVEKLVASPGFNLNLWIFLPTDSSILGPNTNSDTVWSIWRRFRTQCGNSERLQLGLVLTEDLDNEFTDTRALERWRAEPLVALLIDYSLFIAATAVDEPAKLALTNSHSVLLTSLTGGSPDQHLLLSSRHSALANTQQKQLLESIESQLDENAQNSEEVAILARYFDELQAPLQPLSTHLGSVVYHTFEQDKTKYECYRSAIRLAMADLLEQLALPEIVLIVLGAGRGPLVTAALEAAEEVRKSAGKDRFRLNIFAVEKNPNAVLSLAYCNELCWSNSVRIIQADMRALERHLADGVLDRPDIVVSELLGSFGDNELSPECLDGVNGILKGHTVCIPHSYTNFIAPVQSLQLYQKIRKNDERRGKEGTGQRARATDQLYVVCLRQHCLLDEPQRAFRFVHPNRDGTPNAREARLQFTVQPNTELMGFAGYFEVVLYKDVLLSTHPARHTPALHSWFPALFPLRQLFHFERQSRVAFCIARRLEDGGENKRCWYEWHIEIQDANCQAVLHQSDLQNGQGESQHMKLTTAAGDDGN